MLMIGSELSFGKSDAASVVVAEGAGMAGQSRWSYMDSLRRQRTLGLVAATEQDPVVAQVSQRTAGLRDHSVTRMISSLSSLAYPTRNSHPRAHAYHSTVRNTS